MIAIEQGGMADLGQGAGSSPLATRQPGALRAANDASTPAGTLHAPSSSFGRRQTGRCSPFPSPRRVNSLPLPCACLGAGRLLRSAPPFEAAA
jgi:hypothetical protein